jgi:hypothetical protein
VVAMAALTVVVVLCVNGLVQIQTGVLHEVSALVPGWSKQFGLCMCPIRDQHITATAMEENVSALFDDARKRIKGYGHATICLIDL